MLESFWVKKINNKKILEIKRLKGGVSCEVYKAKTIKNTAFAKTKTDSPKDSVFKGKYIDKI